MDFQEPRNHQTASFFVINILLKMDRKKMIKHRDLHLVNKLSKEELIPKHMRLKKLREK